MLIAKLRETLLDLKQNLCNLHHKIEIIDSKLELQSSIKNYRNDIETRGIALEDEVKWLREEIETTRDLLGLKLHNTDSGKS